MTDSDAEVSEAKAGEPDWLPEMWRGLEASGWLEDVPAEEHEALRRRLAASEEPSEAYADLAVIAFDAECIDAPGSYADIIRRLADASHGRFKPENVRDTWDDDGHLAHVGFDIGDERFEVHVKIDGDWFQDEVLELVNDALKAVGSPHRFVPLPVPDQIIYGAFVRPETFERATELGVVPSVEEVFAELEAEIAQTAGEVEALEAARGRSIKKPAVKSKATTKKKAAKKASAPTKARAKKEPAAKAKAAKKKKAPAAKTKAAKKTAAKTKAAKKKAPAPKKKAARKKAKR